MNSNNDIYKKMSKKKNPLCMTVTADLKGTF